MRIVAGHALADPGSIEEAQHAVGGLRANAQPVADPVAVELHALGRILRQQRVIGPDLLDKAAITRVAAVRHNNPVIRPFLGAGTGQTNCNCHYKFLS